MGLIYALMLNHEAVQEEGRLYEDFDYRFLNSEFVIYREILKLAKSSDSLESESRPLVGRLL